MRANEFVSLKSNGTQGGGCIENEKETMCKANVKRSLRGADAAQEGDNVGFVFVDGAFEWSAAVTAVQRVGDNTNASLRGAKYRTCPSRPHPL